jgi:hypothetical protein
MFEKETVARGVAAVLKDLTMRESSLVKSLPNSANEWNAGMIDRSRRQRDSDWHDVTRQLCSVAAAKTGAGGPGAGLITVSLV